MSSKDYYNPARDPSRLSPSEPLVELKVWVDGVPELLASDGGAREERERRFTSMARLEAFVADMIQDLGGANLVSAKWEYASADARAPTRWHVYLTTGRHA